MRKIIYALAAFAALTMSALADDAALLQEYRTLCSKLPPKSARQEPTDPYVILRKSSANIQQYCGGGVARHIITGCTVFTGKSGEPDSWIIAIDSGLTSKEYACVLLYEKAHLPPNNWVDEAWETHITGKTQH